MVFKIPFNLSHSLILWFAGEIWAAAVGRDTAVKWMVSVFKKKKKKEKVLDRNDGLLGAWGPPERSSKPAKILSHLAPHPSATDSAVFPSSSCISSLLSVLKPGMISVLNEWMFTTAVAIAPRGPQDVPIVLGMYKWAEHIILNGFPCKGARCKVWQVALTTC